MKNKNQTMILSALVAGLAVCGANIWQARGAPVGCGAVLTSNTTLQNDLDCSGAALVIGADNITVNLNGHTLRSLDGLGVGVAIAGHNGVTVKNGVIDGFQEAIRAQEASDLTLQGLTIPSISGNGIIPGHWAIVGAIHVLGGNGVKIQYSSIAAGPPIISEGVFGPDAILLESVRDVSIKNVNVEGGFSGVNFGSCGDESYCPPLTDQLPSTGTVKNSTLANNFAGVVLYNAADITIKENVISGADQGIRAGLIDVLPPANVSIFGNELFGNAIGIEAFLVPTVSEFPGPIFDCKIAGNYVHENSVGGIQLVNGQNCKVTENLSENNARFGINLDSGCANNVISENHVANNGLRGIVLTWDNYNNRIFHNTVLDNGVEGITLFRGVNTGNQITDNTSLGNGVWDLFHNGVSTPNVWKDNTYNTKSGSDIP